MAKRKSQDGDYTKFSLPQPHHPSTQPKANDEMEPPEMDTSQAAQSEQASSEQAQSQQAQSEESPLPGLDP